MFCKKCGKQIKDGVQFCMYCGERISMPQPAVRSDHEDDPDLEAAREDIQEDTQSDVQKRSGNLLPVILAGVVLVLAAAAALGYFILSGGFEKPEEPERLSDQEKEADSEPDLSDSAFKDDAEDVPELEQEPQEGSEESEETEPEDPAEEVSEEGIHTYELIIGDVTWTQAYEDCLARGGYLVRINSDEEYQAILQQIHSEEKDKIKFWIGGRRGSEDSYEYRWAYEKGKHGDEILNEDGKYASYWLSGEPSYQDEAVGSQEMYMNMFYMSREDRWVWNDVPDDLIAVVSNYAGTVGYICEYED